MNPIVNALNTLDACDESIEWVQQQDTQDPQQLWDSCPEPNWLVWLIARTTKSEPFSEGRKPLTRCLLEIVKLIPDMPKVALNCIKVTEKWLEGKATNHELKQVADDVYASAADTVYADAVYFATVADGAYSAVYYAIKAGVRKETCLKIIHKHFPNPPKIELNKITVKE